MQKINNPAQFDNSKEKALRGLSLTAEETGEALAAGLSSGEVAALTREGKCNIDTAPQSKTVGNILRENLFTAFHALNLVLAAAVLLTGSFKNALFIGVVILNAGIGIFQELRAKRLIDRLSLVAAPHARVIRDGTEQTITKEKIVPGDALLLRTGDQVTADARVLFGSCEANESLLTGEADAIKKNRGDELSSGSFIVSGSCLAKVIHVGADNYSAKITERAKRRIRPRSEIMTAVNRIIKTLAIAIVPVGLALFCRQYFISASGISEAVLGTVAALVGMIPEGLVLLTSIVMAVSSLRLAEQGALVQELYSVEMLARVDVLCLDKTGTITSGNIKLAACSPAAGFSEKEVLSAAAKVVYGLDETNATGRAVRAAAQDPGILPEEKAAFSSERKWSGVRADGVSYLLGAPQFLLAGRPGILEQISHELTQAGSRGYRVLAAARSAGSIEGARIPKELEFLGLIFFTDELRESARQTLAFFKEQGVSIKIISGDDALAVSGIAAAAGLENADDFVDAGTLTDTGALADAAKTYTVFGRVSPEQKLEIVKTLKSDGHTVAMMGDGVNDVMALRESDCSIAVASGSDAARNVSQIVLLDSDFARLPEIVSEGRRSINNLQRSSTLFLSKTIFSLIAAALFIFLPAGYPLRPIQLTLISALTIGAPSFVLALEPNHERVRGDFLANVLRSALPGGTTAAIIVAAASVLGPGLGLGSAQVTTTAVLLAAFTGFMVLVRVSLPFDRLRAVLIIAMVFTFAGAKLAAGDFFEFSPVTRQMLCAFAVFAGAAVIIYLALLYATAKFFKRKEKDEKGDC